MEFKERPRKQPDFPDFDQKSGLAGVLEFIMAILLWIVLLVVFFFTVYTNWFRRSFQSVLHYFGYNSRQIPFLIAGLITFFFFPVTLIFLLLGYILKK